MIRSFKGKTPVVHPSAFVSETAYVVGDVEIGEDSNIWPGCVIRADNAKITVGKGTSIQDNCVVHSDFQGLVIGDHCLIGHGVVVHGVKIGNHCLIGNNSTVLDEVEIGDYCIVAANAVVREGTKVPSHSFVVGVPAEVRPLSPKQRERLGEGRDLGPDHYVRRGREFKEEGL